MRALAIVAAALLVASAAAFYEGKTAVVNLTPENFEEKVVKSSGLWLVEFYAPWCGHCKQLAPNWEKAADALKGTVNFGAIDADKYRELGTKFNVEGFPTIKFFGDDKSKPTEYAGGRTAEELVKTALSLAKKVALDRVGIKDTPKEEKKEEKKQQQQQGGGFYDGTDVVELTDETFESEVMNAAGKGGWLVEFYAPWCGHCKNLAPAWKAAATQLAGAMHIAAIDATAHKKFAEKYQVNGFPTIKFFPPGGENPEDYNGGRSVEAIVAFGNEKAEKFPMAPVVVKQLEDQAALESTCKDKNVCLVFVVPHVIDTGAAGRNKMLEMFASIYTKVRARGVGAGWIVGGEHTNFEEGFGVYSTYPTYMAFAPTPRKKDGLHVYGVHKGAFKEDSLVASLKALLDGKSGATIKAIPKLSKGVPLWDGNDYVASDE